ncbi:MAG: hypothetical protein P8X96_02055 [Desulfobacteraceae bacterium]|jgi:hypothetical protein
MFKVKTFTMPLMIFQVRNKLEALDQEVNRFLEEVQAKRVVAVSDTHTTDDSGATMGLIRVVTYES